MILRAPRRSVNSGHPSSLGAAASRVHPGMPQRRARRLGRAQRRPTFQVADGVRRAGRWVFALRARPSLPHACGLGVSENKSVPFCPVLSVDWECQKINLPRFVPGPPLGPDPYAPHHVSGCLGLPVLQAHIRPLANQELHQRCAVRCGPVQQESGRLLFFQRENSNRPDFCSDSCPTLRARWLRASGAVCGCRPGGLAGGWSSVGRPGRRRRRRPGPWPCRSPAREGRSWPGGRC